MIGTLQHNLQKMFLKLSVFWLLNIEPKLVGTFFLELVTVIKLNLIHCCGLSISS